MSDERPPSGSEPTGPHAPDGGQPVDPSGPAQSSGEHPAGYGAPQGAGQPYGAPQGEPPQGPGYNAPQYQPPQGDNPGYSAPQYQPPQGDNPGYTAPQYQPPPGDNPGYNAPQYQPPQGDNPGYSAPQYPPPTDGQYGPPPAGYNAYGAPGAGAYGAPGGPPPKKSRKGLIIGLAAGVVVLLVVVVGAFALLGGGGGKPEDTVKNYLQALADGKADTALAQGPTPTSKVLLTDAILKQQQAKAKISNIKIGQVRTAGNNAQVHATYTFGPKSADEMFDLTKISGKWKLDDTVYPIDISDINDIPGLTVYGVATTGLSKVYVFPGPLEWGSSNKYLSVTEEKADDFSVSPSDASFSFATLQTDLSDAGKTAIADAVQKALATCAASTSLTPDNCPQAEYDYEGVDGSAKWTAPADLSKLQYQSGSPATKVDVSGDLTWTVTYQAKDFDGNVTTKTDDAVDGSVYGEVDLTQTPPVFTSS